MRDLSEFWISNRAGEGRVWHNIRMIKTGAPGDKFFLPYQPKAGWDGWFGIAVFPAYAPVRWCKAHFYRRWSPAPPERYPLSLLESIGQRTEVMIATATTESVQVDMADGFDLAPAVCPNPLEIDFGDEMRLRKEESGYRLSYRVPGTEKAMDFKMDAGWPIYWSKFGRILQYVGVHSAASVSLDKSTLNGLGVIEHVTGASIPFDFRRVLPVTFHWDVLSFDKAVSRFDSAAGLSIGHGGNTLVPLKAAAQVPGEDPSNMRGLYLKYLEVESAAGENGGEVMVPVRWEGMMRSRHGTLRYEARASTPCALILPLGGMLGFDFEAVWTGHGKTKRTLIGTGFTEYGGFTSRLGTLPSRLAGRP